MADKPLTKVDDRKCDNCPYRESAHVLLEGKLYCPTLSTFTPADPRDPFRNGKRHY